MKRDRIYFYGREVSFRKYKANFVEDIESGQLISGYQMDNKYQCPVKCEGLKTYDQPGDCPVCNARYVTVRKINIVEDYLAI